MTRGSLLKTLKWLSLGSVIFFVMWVWIVQDKYFPIREIKIEGNFRFLNHRQVEQQILPYVDKKGFFNIDIFHIKEELQDLAWVREAWVKREWPYQLRIEIREHEPVARWGNGSLLDKEGAVFSPTPLVYPAGLPIFYGPTGQQQLLMKSYQQMSGILKQLKLHIYRIMMSKRGAWSLQLNNGMHIVLGRDDVYERLQRFVQVYPQVFFGKEADVEKVDLRYAQGMAVRWKTTNALQTIKSI